jgi:hypothetical protein
MGKELQKNDPKQLSFDKYGDACQLEFDLNPRRIELTREMAEILFEKGLRVHEWFSKGQPSLRNLTSEEMNFRYR